MGKISSKNLFISIVVIGLGLAVFFLWKNRPTTTPATGFAKVEYFRSQRGPAANGRQLREATILYKIKDDASAAQKAELEKVFRQYDIQVQKKMLEDKVHFAKSQKRDATGNESELINAISQTGAVDFVEGDGLVELNSVPNDPYLPSQWHHTRVDSLNAWNTTAGDGKIIVASCDTGIEDTHPDLKDNLTRLRYNSEDGTNNTSPIHPHGTMWHNDGWYYGCHR
jgi:hypothetical protein